MVTMALRMAPKMVPHSKPAWLPKCPRFSKMMSNDFRCSQNSSQLLPNWSPWNSKLLKTIENMTSKADNPKQTHGPTDRPKSNRDLLTGFVDTNAYSRCSPRRRHKQHAKAKRHGGGMRSNWISISIHIVSVYIYTYIYIPYMFRYAGHSDSQLPRTHAHPSIRWRPTYMKSSSISRHSWDRAHTNNCSIFQSSIETESWRWDTLSI